MGEAITLPSSSSQRSAPRFLFFAGKGASFLMPIYAQNGGFKKYRPYQKDGTSALKEAIARLPIPVLWRKLGLPGEIRDCCSVHSPLRDDDRNPSFSIFAAGTKWKDHATGEHGDSFDLFKAVRRLEGKTAYHQFLHLAGL